MQFGKAVGIACSTFAISNIDDIFVLVTFFAEASTSNTLTPLKIIIGQYIGFTIILAICMIGFGASLVFPFQAIGFLGLLPILLGVWKGLDDLLDTEDEEEELENLNISSIKSILKVASITVVNGGDDFGTYIPLFSQAKGAEIAVYVVTYYILLGVWCFIIYSVMGQTNFLRVVQTSIHWLLPLLYIGLGIFIIIDSTCYPWSIERIDKKVPSHPGKVIMGCVTAFLLLACTGAMVWVKLRKRAHRVAPSLSGSGEENSPLIAEVAHSEQENSPPAIEVDDLRGEVPVPSQNVDGFLRENPTYGAI